MFLTFLIYSGVPVIQVSNNKAESQQNGNSNSQKRSREDDSGAKAVDNTEERPAKKVDAKDS